MQVVLKTVSWILLLYAGYCCLLFLLQRQMMFPRYLIDVPPERNIPGAEKMWIDTEYGKIEAWFLPPVPGKGKIPAPAVIFAHGNGELIDFWPEEFRPFTQLGIGVLLVEYPGYGRSEGKPSQQSITDTFVTAYDLLISRKDVDSSRIILVGRSIGGGAICQLAAKRPSAALILMSAFISARSFAPRYLAPGFLVQDPFDNREVVRSYPEPVLVIHGNRDELIPYKHGTALFRSAKQGKMITYDAGHNDCPPVWNVFWEDMGGFLRQTNILSSEPAGNSESIQSSGEL